jgi:nitrous oxidase accessory protein NosD
VSRLLAVSCLLVSASALDAATICVHPTEAGCFRRIQQGVDAAQPGDLVQVGPGVYAENVTVPAAKDHLRLEGAGPQLTIVDPVPLNTGAGFTIYALGVELRGFRVRAGSSSVRLDGEAKGVTIQGMRLLGARLDSAIEVGGADATQILDNEIRGANWSAIELGFQCLECVVAGNRISNARGGIEGERADGLEVRGNEIVGTRVAGVAVTGDDVRIVANTFVDVDERPIAVVGARPLIFENQTRNTGPSQVTCTACDGGQVYGNRSHSVLIRQYFDGTGWSVQAQSPGLLMVSNYVSRASSPAYYIQGQEVLLDNNRAIDSIRSDGFWILGEGHLLRGNSAIRSGVNGFTIAGDDIGLEVNTSSEARRHGFAVQGGLLPADGTRLTGNAAAFSRAAGFAVLPGALATSLTGNRGGNNRYDFCDDGTGTQASANLFQTVSSVCDPVE